MHVSELVEHGAPEPLVEEWKRAIEELTPVQVRAVEAGALGGTSNLLVVAPTTSGKTFVGEMAAATAAYRTRKPAFFLVPFRALADEHFELFRERYRELLSVVISTSDWDEFDNDIRSGNFGLAVLTYEKLTGLLVNRPQLLSEMSVLVVDEVQMLRDRGRGPNLEFMLTQVMLTRARPQLVALSASLDDLNKLDQWLDAKVIHENERPIPLDEGVVAPMSGSAYIRSGSKIESQRLFPGADDKDEAVASLCAKLVSDGKQVLVFRTSATRAQPTADAVARILPAPGLSVETAALLEGLEPSETLEAQRRLLASAVGFHTADLPSGERRAVERSFRNGDTKVIVSSGTLAMGVNLPTDVVLVVDTIRFIPNQWAWNRETVTVADYKNQVGRAGRLGKRERGLGLLIADNDSEIRQLFDLYCNGIVEPVESQLPVAAFEDVVFKVLAADLASTREGVVEFLSSTFAFLTFWQHSGGLPAVQGGVERAVEACLTSKLVSAEGDQLHITRSGRILAARGIPLAEATLLSDLADSFIEGSLPIAEIIFRIASCDGLFERRPYTKWDRTTRRLYDPRSDLSIDVSEISSEHGLHQALSVAPRDDNEARALLRTACLLEWIDGTPESKLTARYMGCGYARLRGMGQTASWLLDAATRVAAIRHVDDERVAALQRLTLRLRYGLPYELAPLARLNAPGIARTALLGLFQGDNGRELYDPDNLLEANAEDLDGLLTPREAGLLQTAIIAERGESLRRHRRGHRARAERSSFDARLIDDLYTTTGSGLEQAIADSLAAVDLSVTRIVRQPHGEEDLQLDHGDGTVVISVTASDSDTKAISWRKAREVLGTGAGLNPINYVCIGRPAFHSLAERRVLEIAQETGERRLLLVPLYVLADAVLRCQEGRLNSERLGDLLAHERGLFDIDALENAAEEQLPE
jgi:helicase